MRRDRGKTGIALLQPQQIGPQAEPPTGVNFQSRRKTSLRGKGDHKHAGKIESPYHFTSPAQLMADFMTDIKGLNHE